MHDLLVAEEAIGLFSHHILLFYSYPLLDWAPDCRKEGDVAGADEREEGEGREGWWIDAAFIWVGAGMLPTSTIHVKHLTSSDSTQPMDAAGATRGRGEEGAMSELTDS